MAAIAAFTLGNTTTPKAPYSQTVVVAYTTVALPPLASGLVFHPAPVLETSAPAPTGGNAVGYAG